MGIYLLWSQFIGAEGEAANFVSLRIRGPRPGPILASDRSRAATSWDRRRETWHQRPLAQRWRISLAWPDCLSRYPCVQLVRRFMEMDEAWWPDAPGLQRPWWLISRFHWPSKHVQYALPMFYDAICLCWRVSLVFLDNTVVTIKRWMILIVINCVELTTHFCFGNWDLLSLIGGWK